MNREPLAFSIAGVHRQAATLLDQERIQVAVVVDIDHTTLAPDLGFVVRRLIEFRIGNPDAKFFTRRDGFLSLPSDLVDDECIEHGFSYLLI
jgi:hypothetical protein